MVNKLPEPRVNGEAYPWARDINYRLPAAEESISRFRQDFLNANSSQTNVTNLLGEQVNTLQQQQALLEQQQQTLAEQQQALEDQQAAVIAQQAYLASLVTYAIQTGTVSSTDTSGGLITSGDTNPSLTFTLPQELKCRITLRASASMAVSGNSASVFTNGQIFSAIGMDGAIYSGGQGTAYVSLQPGSGANHNIATTTDIVSQVIVDLAAGTHTAYSRWQFRANAVSANLRVLAPVLTVDVIGLP